MNQDTNTETAASQNEQDAASRMNDLQKQLLELGIDVSSTIGKVSRSNLIKQLKQAKSRLKATQEAAVKAERDARLVSTSFQPYRIYLVCDIEATCDSDSGFDFASEVIEFPVIAIDGTTMETVSTFRRYCRPILHPTLTDFCKQLTGITQEQTDAADPFTVVFADFLEWMLSLYPSTDGVSALTDEVIFVTDGPWDLRDFLEKEFIYSNIQRPDFMRKIINIRSLYTELYGKEKTNLDGMLKGLGMVFEGREHCGFDDASNVARILRRMVEDGHRIEKTSDISKKSSKGSWKLLRK